MVGMEKRNFLGYLSEITTAVFIPFFIVLSIEFVLKIGMGPFVEKISLFFPIFASLLGLSTYIWIRKGIIFSLVPILLSPLVLMLFFIPELSPRVRFFYFLISVFILTFVSILVYAVSKVVKKHSSSRVLSIVLFFVGILVFVLAFSVIDIVFSLFNPPTPLTKSLVHGVQGGLLLGSGVTIVVLLLVQRVE
jgi:hypothetical protein